jgi:hypothetical protein
MATFRDRSIRRVNAQLRRAARFVRAKRGGLFFDGDRNDKNSLLLAGSGRGGTTWVAEVINYRNDFRYIFEPFLNNKVKSCRHFAFRQYLRPENNEPQYLNPARRIFSGSIRSDWTDAFNKRFFCTKRLIKDIRVNLFLKWIRAHFPEMPIVFVLRHPCAVVTSRLHLGWNDNYADFLHQTQLIQDHLEPFVKPMTQAKTPFERHMFFWCVENYVPLQQLRRGDVHVMFYEDLCVKPELELQRLSRYLGARFDEEAVRKLGIPSTQTRRRTSAIALHEDLTASWKKQVTSEMLERAVEILALFDLTAVYGPEPLPRITADNLLLPRDREAPQAYARFPLRSGP